jgi:hypothetical protein
MGHLTPGAMVEKYFIKLHRCRSFDSSNNNQRWNAKLKACDFG